MMVVCLKNLIDREAVVQEDLEVIDLFEEAALLQKNREKAKEIFEEIYHFIHERSRGKMIGNIDLRCKIREIEGIQPDGIFVHLARALKYCGYGCRDRLEALRLSLASLALAMQKLPIATTEEQICFHRTNIFVSERYDEYSFAVDD